LDKLIGSLWVENCLQGPGFLLMSSRASYEIVQKAAKAGIAVIATLSAPTSMAIDLAASAGMTLIGFARESRHLAYSHAHRLTN
jgi:formate dehydrogenase accessory protein FdhD